MLKTADMKAYHRNRYHDKKAKGICIQCSNLAADNRVMCVECLEKRKKETARNKEKKKIYDKKRLLERKAKGLCYHCSNKAVDGYTECEKCRAKRREYQHINREKKNQQARDRRRERKIQGLCLNCNNKAQENRVCCVKCGEKYRKNSIQWARNNPEKAKARKYRNRALMLNASGYASAEKILARAKLFGFKCYMCGGKYTEMDHLIPLALGGANWPANLRPICRSCNASKNDSINFREVKCFEYIGRS